MKVNFPSCRWLMAGLVSLAVNLEAAELPFPSPRPGELEEYLHEAIAYVKKHPDSPYKPRVLMDMLMVFAANRKEQDMENVRRTLIAQHPDTLEGRFAVSLFEDAGEYRTTLLKMFNEDEDGSQTGFGKAFIMRAMIGMKTFGVDIFKNAEFLTRSIFGAEEAGDVKLKDQLLRMMRSDKVGTKSEKALMRVAFDNKLDHVDKLQTIHEQPESGTGKFLTSYLMSRLSEKERNAVPLRMIFIESKLRSSGWAAAIKAIEALDSKSVDAAGQAQLRFWKGWAQAAEGSLEDGLATLDRLARGPSETIWHRHARSLRAALAKKEEGLEANAEAVKVLVQSVAAGVEVAEFSLRWFAADDLGFSVYLNYQQAKEEVQLFLQREDEIRLAYSFNPRRSRMYTAADKTTIVGQGNMPTFTPKIKVTEGEDGQLNFNVSGQTAESLEPSASAFKDLLALPLLSSREGRRRIVSRLIGQGWIPLVPKGDAVDQRVLEWIVPHTDQAEFKTVRFTTTDNGMLRSIESVGEYRLQCQYGNAEQVTLKPPAWPRSRVTGVSKQNFGLALVSKFIPAIMEMAAQPNP